MSSSIEYEPVIEIGAHLSLKLVLQIRERGGLAWICEWQ